MLNVCAIRYLKNFFLSFSLTDFWDFDSTNLRQNVICLIIFFAIQIFIRKSTECRLFDLVSQMSGKRISLFYRKNSYRSNAMITVIFAGDRVLGLCTPTMFAFMLPAHSDSKTFPAISSSELKTGKQDLGPVLKAP